MKCLARLTDAMRGKEAVEGEKSKEQEEKLSYRDGHLPGQNASALEREGGECGKLLVREIHPTRSSPHGSLKKLLQQT